MNRSTPELDPAAGPAVYRKVKDEVRLPAYASAGRSTCRRLPNVRLAGLDCTFAR